MLIIIGIISVIILGRSDIGRTDLMAQTEVIKSHIRYAQSRAMDSSQRWGIQCNGSGQAYWLFVDGQPNDEKRKLPGEESDTVDLSRYNLTLTPTTLSFDDRGRPCSDVNGQTPRVKRFVADPVGRRRCEHKHHHYPQYGICPMTSNQADETGFTLIEIIVTLTVAGILSVMLMQFMGTSISRSAEPILSN